MALGFHTAARLTGILAIVFQAFVPAAFAQSEDSAAAVRTAICAPSGAVSADALSEMQALMQALGIEGEPTPEDREHCPHCVFSHAGALPTPALLSLPANAGDATGAAPLFEIGLTLQTTGPPLGQRGPPNLS